MDQLWLIQYVILIAPVALLSFALYKAIDSRSKKWIIIMFTLSWILPQYCISLYKYLGIIN